ncbi:toxin Cry1Ac domain D-VI-related protein [Listeria rocourtiae]|uniref:toxin Cry1Ac domain D-VI-related protein n=1 Tax=Listeria rocourtiae TaxID=647910 RepID=UPI0003E8AA64|nr:toxin Cry1Ac domain D-VI-related protein [Listeria rocourtiae]EUJ48371.1 hypothetical protein PROCOU_05473 [Listeria rocourtiae FSL F6-920]
MHVTQQWQKKARQEAAEASIKGLFNNGDVKGTIKDITNQAAIDSARVLVNAVTDQTKKTELENNLKEAQKQLDTRNAAIAEKARQEAAEASVKELFKNGDVTGVIKDTTDKAAIDKAQTAINAVTDTTKKAALQKDLDTAKKQLSQIGEEYLYTFKGYADRVFGTMKVSIKNMQATMSTMAGVPHSYFSDAYVSVQIEKENGTVTYSKDYIGNKTYPDTTEQATLNIGDYITVTHKEPAVRFSIDNLTNQTTLAKGNTTIYMVTSTGLVEVTQKEKDTAIAEVSVKELFKNNDVTGDIKDTTNQVSIDNAQKLVDAVTDTTKKSCITKRFR